METTIYFRGRPIVRADLACLALLSVLSQIVYVCILPITFEGDAGGYFLYALFLVGDPRGAFQFFRPPGMPYFMAATGLTWLHSFALAIAVQAAMGAAVPLLVFGALRGINRTAALAAATLLTVSGVPYSYAKLFTADQLYLICVILTIFAVARFATAKRPRPRYAIIAMGGAVAAVMVRNEAVYFALLSFLVLVVSAWPARRLMAAVGLSGGAALALVLAWSVARALIMGDLAVIGSLSNFTGHQLFARIYIASAYEIRRWQCVVTQPGAPSCASPTPAMSPIRPENGPATRRLFEIVHDWAVMSGYEPGAFLADFVANPTEGPEGRPYNRLAVASNESLRLYGYAKSDNFLMRVALEAIVAHPEIIYGMAANASEWFGISFEALVHDLRSPRDFVFPFFTNWQADAYEVAGIDAEGLLRKVPTPSYVSQMIMAYEVPAHNAAVVAEKTMTPELWRSYQKANETSMGSDLDWELLSAGRFAHSLALNIAGFLILVTLPLFPFARHRLLAFYLLAAFGVHLCAYTAGFGYNMRYQHLMLSLMIMAATFPSYTLVRLAARALNIRPRARPRHS